MCSLKKDRFTIEFIYHGIGPFYFPSSTHRGIEIKKDDYISVTVFTLLFKVVPPGIEPGTQGFSVLCSTI